MQIVRVSDLLKEQKQPLLSFEFFPPKDTAGLELLKKTAHNLLGAHPDFVTVTCGALGSARGRTLEICNLLRTMGYPLVAPHMTCVGVSKRELGEIADELYAAGYRTVMALRGDPPVGETEFARPADGLAHASELVALLKARHPEMCCGVAGYPEKHPEAESLEADIARLREKLEAGGSFVTTQLFYDNSVFFDFVRRCRNAGISQPLIPGLMPALSRKQIQRVISKCSTALPTELASSLEAAGDDAEAAAAVGIDWTVRQVRELLENGAQGIHLYVMNRDRAALAPALLDCLRQYRSR